MNFKNTDWRITGASGGAVMVGTPELQVEIGAGYIRMPILNTKTGEKAMLKGSGMGAGLGVSLSIPFVNASGSLDSFPADGIGSIVQGPVALPKYKISNFEGDIMVFSLNAGKEISFQLSGVLWLKQSAQSCLAGMNCSKEEMLSIAKLTVMRSFGVMVPGVGLANESRMLYNRTKAIGCFSAMNVATQLAGAGGDIFYYRVKA